MKSKTTNFKMTDWLTYAKHSDFKVRWSIFGKDAPQIPVEILAYLADDIDWVIRVEVAAYSKTPLEILKHLAVDAVYGVRASVWNNPNCTEEIRLLILSHKKYEHLVNCHTQSPSDSDFGV